MSQRRNKQMKQTSVPCCLMKEIQNGKCQQKTETPSNPPEVQTISPIRNLDCTVQPEPTDPKPRKPVTYTAKFRSWKTLRSK
ncbi:hypothetical protein B0T21DRAFT_357777 [Apiosordaria backusii]|uniref:Uncharacterized protein n=1 Tax=Apiosordaria backusii TaxID=314023 RepID=A0AA40ES51_9PEZI|nr:hypothetical protein B0T21DRAFT_357777 [Apiosordaria backusii]